MATSERVEGLLRSLKSPHPEAAELAETGLADWAAGLPPDDEGLVDVNAGKPVHWVEGQGWVDARLALATASISSPRD